MRKKLEKKNKKMFDLELKQTTTFQINYPFIAKLFGIVASWYLRFIIITFCDWRSSVPVYFPCLLISYLILIYIYPENFEFFDIFTHCWAVILYLIQMFVLTLPIIIFSDTSIYKFLLFTKKSQRYLVHIAMIKIIEIRYNIKR